MSDGVLSRSWRTRLCHRNRVDQLTCFRCGREIRLEDSIHTNGDNIHACIKHCGLKSIRVYHQDCYESLFIEC